MVFNYRHYEDVITEAQGLKDNLTTMSHRLESFTRLLEANVEELRRLLDDEPPTDDDVSPGGSK